MTFFGRFAPLLLSSGIMLTAALAQTAGTPVDVAPVPLGVEKQALVKEHVRRAKPGGMQTSAPVTVGAMAPENVELWGLPQDSVTEVPTVTSYKFFLAGDAIAVVDLTSRRVIQLIQK